MAACRNATGIVGRGSLSNWAKELRLGDPWRRRGAQLTLGGRWGGPGGCPASACGSTARPGARWMRILSVGEWSGFPSAAGDLVMAPAWAVRDRSAIVGWSQDRKGRSGWPAVVGAVPGRVVIDRLNCTVKVDERPPTPLGDVPTSGVSDVSRRAGRAPTNPVPDPVPRPGFSREQHYPGGRP